MPKSNKYPILSSISADDFIIGLTSKGWLRRFSGGIISSIAESVNAEASAREAADYAISESVNAEAVARSVADDAINQRIDNVVDDHEEDFGEISNKITDIMRGIIFVDTIDDLKSISLEEASKITNVIVSQYGIVYKWHPDDESSIYEPGFKNVAISESPDAGRFIKAGNLNTSSFVGVFAPGEELIELTIGDTVMFTGGGNYNISMRSSPGSVPLNNWPINTLQIWKCIEDPIISISAEVTELVSGSGSDYSLEDYMDKATFDPNGVGADAFSMGNMTETSSNKIFTTDEREKLAELSDSVVQTPFTTSVPFNKALQFMELDLANNTKLLINKSGTKNGNTTYLTVNINTDADVNLDLSNFRKSGGSFDFSNKYRNLIKFYKDGDNYWYRIIEQVKVIPGTPGGTIDINNRIFPNAVGYGTTSKGAYGGSVDPEILIVSTLSAENTGSGNRGSFSWACSRDYPRIILFEVSGVIDYEGQDWRVQVENPYMSIYGQSAPGKGVTIKGATLWLQSTDALIQHIKIRPGEHTGTGPNEIDAVNFYHGASRTVLDHCSLGWSVDELVGSKETVSNLTFSHCFFTEPLDMSWHIKESDDNAERHAYCALMYAANVTFYKNLFAFSFGRNPLVRQANNQVINNYIYAGQYAGPMLENIGYEIQADIIGNHVEPFGIDGADIASSAEVAVYNVNNQESGSRLYVSDNICKLNIDNPALSDWDCVRANTGITQSLTPVTDLTGFDILPANEVKDYVLENAGAFYWNRDDVDQGVINRINNRVKDLRNSQNPYPATIRSRNYTAVNSILNGYDFSSDNRRLKIAYQLDYNGTDFYTFDKVLDQNCADIDAIVAYLNSLFDAHESATGTRLVCSRIGSPLAPTNQIQISLSGYYPRGYLIISNDPSGVTPVNEIFDFPTEPSTPIYSAQYYETYDMEAETSPITLPSNPHVDSNANGYTNLEEWAYGLSEELATEDSYEVVPWPFARINQTPEEITSGRAFTEDDLNKVFEYNGAANISMVVNADVLTPGGLITIIVKGDGTIAISPGANVTINGSTMSPGKGKVFQVYVNKKGATDTEVTVIGGIS